MATSTDRRRREGRFTCETCLKTFSFLSDLRRHTISHLPNKTDYYHTCPFPGCGRSMAQSYNLTIHMRIHTGQQLQCDVCSFTTPDDGYMLKHKEKEHDILPPNSRRNPRKKSRHASDGTISGRGSPESGRMVNGGEGHVALPQVSASRDSKAAEKQPPIGDIVSPPARQPPKGPNGRFDWLCEEDGTGPRSQPHHTPQIPPVSRHAPRTGTLSA